MDTMLDKAHDICTALSLLVISGLEPESSVLAVHWTYLESFKTLMLGHA